MKRTRDAGGRRTLANLAYHHLRADIVSGRLAAGAKLKLERLVADYDVGMAPLREALARLVGDALVVSAEQRGFWVAPLEMSELDDVLRVRALVESEALSLAICNGDAAWEAGLRASFEALSEVEATLPDTAAAVEPELWEAWEARNRAFHAALVSACGSPWLMRLRVQFYEQSERYRRVSLGASRGRRFVHDEHTAIYDAAMQRNALRACRLTEEHLARTAEEVRRAVAAQQTGVATGDDQLRSEPVTEPEPETRPGVEPA